MLPIVLTVTGFALVAVVFAWIIIAYRRTNG